MKGFVTLTAPDLSPVIARVDRMEDIHEMPGGRTAFRYGEAENTRDVIVREDYLKVMQMVQKANPEEEA
jgi:hypothetical protein